jgi:hypothetical protein
MIALRMTMSESTGAARTADVVIASLYGRVRSGEMQYRFRSGARHWRH